MKVCLVLILWLGSACAGVHVRQATVLFNDDDNDIQRYLNALANNPQPKTAPSTQLPTLPPLVEGCGVRQPVESTLRIGIGGEPAGYTEFKWTVSIFNNLNNTYHCVGSLIHPQVVMSVAHRFDQPGSWTIHAGQYYLSQKNELFKSATSRIREVVLHPRYNPNTLTNDIALLFLETPFQESTNIGFICLPPPGSFTPPGTRCIVTGWGHETLIGGKPSEEMKMVEVPMVDSKTCTRVLRSLLGISFDLSKSMLCAGGEKYQDACVRDGGAALVCPYQDGIRYYQAGIVSFGVGCGREGVPAVYTNVKSLRPWIDQTMASKGYSSASYMHQK